MSLHDDKAEAGLQEPLIPDSKPREGSYDEFPRIESRDAPDGLGHRIRPPPDFSGPVKKRSCTDLFCALLVIGMWGAMTGLGIYASQHGDYRKAVYPLDYKGNICGTDLGEDDMTEYPKLVFVNSYGGGVCVKDCPKIPDPYVYSKTLVTYSGIWNVEDQENPFTPPEDFTLLFPDYSSAPSGYQCTNEECYPDGNVTLSFTSDGINEGHGFAYYAVDTYEVLRRCLPDAKATDTLLELTGQSNPSSQDPLPSSTSGLYVDMYTTRAYTLGVGFAIALAISFMYTLLIRIPGVVNILVWGSIFATTAMTVAGGVVLWKRAHNWNLSQASDFIQDNRVVVLRTFAIILWILAALFLCGLCALRRQIKLAIGCVKQAARAVDSMFSIVLLPVLQAAGLIAFLIAFVFYGAQIAGMGNITISTIPSVNADVTFRNFEITSFMWVSGIYLIFCLLWTLTFIGALGEIVVALAVGKWYFNRSKSKNNRNAWSSLGTVLKYHVGTAAFGSLLIAIVKAIRWVITVVQKQAQKANNKLATCLLCCCQSCFACVENFLKFLDKNAYIQTALFGTSFCESSRRSFELIARNVGKIGAISYVSVAIVFIGRITITALVSGTTYFIMISVFTPLEVNSFVGPTVLTILIAYFVSDMFMNIYDMAISAVLHCFIADEEMFDGDDCYAEGTLKDYIDKWEAVDEGRA
mmetsp:Transcript_37928/g.55919  ORF Transcript_37928/g.55919 Transcript_37928/m.55919 type:complete len:694 (+) Transcript_37928:61-2142(+)|eukprot:CAMPEP_0195518836 /NCGR_PEP_ID=MMETSP0794_2-20130614/13761_1 /TAXON_ID=515487 /ORGANISM="Stephanopyxis turris, Strain CCMP 815" /LENGTH=693 /DNA_ID=CAMNT_0040647865 /DNA_START=61 /DNA_END=2142 /DNA_ORIENTATION=+